MMPVREILSFADYEKQSRKLAQALSLPCNIIQRHIFPDGESRLTLPVKLPEHIIICRSLDQPNEKLLELLLAVKTARQLGAKTITLIAPYLCYMRQDKAFHAGEAISQTIVGQFLAELFDNVITVDPHLHRISKLQQAVPTKHAISLSATSLMADFLREYSDDPVLLAPDSEAEQWVSAVANKDGWEFGVCNKTRSGDRKVDITLPKMDLQGRSVVIVDDIASSGQTLAVAAKKCLAKKAAHVDVLVTHALLINTAKQHLLDAGVRNIWSTDAVTHESNVISLSGLLKQAVLALD